MEDIQLNKLSPNKPKNLRMWDKIHSVCMEKVFNDTFEDSSMGGPICASNTTYLYKLTFILLFLPIQLYFIYAGIKAMKKKVLSPKVFEIQPNLFQKVLGYSLILCFISSFFYKANSHQLIFMFNFCHIAELILAYLLLTKFSYMKWALFYTYLAVYVGPVVALAFPAMKGLNQFMEVEIYLFVHILMVTIAPFTLLLSYKYRTMDCLKYPYYFLGNGILSIYVNIVLTHISILTWANLTESLCPMDSDPFYYYFNLGTTYRFWSVLYTPLVNYIVLAIWVLPFYFIFRKKFQERFLDDLEEEKKRKEE